MSLAAHKSSFPLGHATALAAAVVWSVLVLASLWTQRGQLDRTAAAMARIDAITNLKKDMAIRKWASVVGGIYLNDDRAGHLESLSEQERLVATRGNGESVRLVAVAPVHVLLAIQAISNREYGNSERLTSLQLRNLANAPDDWETKALDSLKGGADMVTEALPKSGSHGLMRVMLPMKMEKECLECHRDTLVPVGGLRGGASMAVDLNSYRNVQEPTWRAIQFWHLGIWLMGLATIYAYWFFARRWVGARQRQDEERLENETAFAAMAEGAIITDAGGRILWVNDAFCRIYGYERAEVIGQNPRILKSGRHNPDFYAELWRQVKTVGRFRGELWNRRKTGEVFPEEISIQALRGPDGQVRRYISIFSDITERKRNEEELRKYREGLEELVKSRTEELSAARDEAERANRSKTLFLANMSHELRTPLNAVIGFSELMNKDPLLAPVQRRNLEIINSSAHHLLTLINDVLELSKIESGKAQLVAEEADLLELARQVMDMMRMRAEQSGLALHLETDRLPPPVLADAVKLRQVLINLLSNAIKFTPAGRVELRLAGASAPPGQARVVFSVRDTGIGIATADRGRIFRPFEQAGDRPHPGGTGLGLTISRQYVEMMGGRLDLASEPGQGTTFSFELPFMLGQAEAPPPAPGTVVGLPPEQHGRHILVVDDVAEARLLMRSLLEPLGFRVTEAADGVAAARAVAESVPDLVFMDWRLPGMDGLEVIRRIRGSAGGRQPRIAVLTAHVFEDGREQAMAAGADDFLAKPFPESDLFALLERLLGLNFERRTPTPSLPACAPVVDAAELAALSAANRVALVDAALTLDSRRIAAALAALAVENPGLAAQLQPLADALDYLRLWQALGLHDSEASR